MSVEVHKEPSEMNCWPKENCCVCRAPTSYWYGTGPLNVALCPTCATRATADSLPTKAQWIDAERRAKRVRSNDGLAVEDKMRKCKCEHWQVCPTCKPDMFDDSGNMLTFPPPPSKETLEAAGHRLALELECLLLDTKDLPTVSRWWSSGMEALEEWQRLFPYNGPRLGD